MRVFLATILLIFTYSSFSNILHAQSSDDGLTHYVRGEELRKARKLRPAIDEYNLAIKQDPTNAKFHYQKGMCYIYLREEDNAISALEEVVALKPETEEAHSRLAWLYQRKEKYDKAIHHFESAFTYSEDQKKKVDYKVNIIKILYKTDRFKDFASTHIQDALSVKPNDIAVLYYSAKLNNMNGNHQQAKQDASKALHYVTNKSPQLTARFYYELGYAHYQLGEYDELETVLPKANYGSFKKLVVKLTPEYKYAIALCYYQIYDFEKSRDLLSDALKLDNTDSKIHDLQIKIAEATSDKTALIAHTKSVASSETDPIRKSVAYAELSKLQLEQGNFQETIDAADQCLRLQEHNYKVGYNRALALYKMNRLQESVEQLQSLVSYNGLDIRTKAKFNFTLGLVSLELGDYKTAKRAFKSAKLDDSFRLAANDVLDYLENEAANSK